jgi:hypothetical protein
MPAPPLPRHGGRMATKLFRNLGFGEQNREFNYNHDV